LFAQRTRIPTSARSIGFCAIWVCISSSSSSSSNEEGNLIRYQAHMPEQPWNMELMVDGTVGWWIVAVQRPTSKVARIFTHFSSLLLMSSSVVRGCRRMILRGISRNFYTTFARHGEERHSSRATSSTSCLCGI
jgi:hypothetical protein